MKIITASFTALFALSISVSANAGNSSGAQYISYFKIDATRIIVYAEAATFIDNAACNGSNETLAVAVSTTRENFKELYAAIMLAHANDRKVNFWLDGGCTSAAAGGPFPTAEMVYVF